MKIRVVTVLTVMGEAEYPEAYPGMTLEQALKYEQELSKEDMIEAVEEAIQFLPPDAIIIRRVVSTVDGGDALPEELKRSARS